MKKTLIGGAALLLAASVASADISLANTFGGDEDNIWGNDFMSWSRKKDDPATTDRDESDEFESSVANVSERLQLDYSSEKIDGRIRLEFSNSTHSAETSVTKENITDGAGDSVNVVTDVTTKNAYTINLGGKNGSLRLRGFARFTPIEQIQFGVGNDFFTKYGVSAAYLAAADDTYSSGKMAESGLAFTAKFNTFKFVANWAGDSKADNLDKLGLFFITQYRDFHASGLHIIHHIALSLRNELTLPIADFIGSIDKNLKLSVTQFIFRCETDQHWIARIDVSIKRHVLLNFLEMS